MNNSFDIAESKDRTVYQSELLPFLPKRSPSASSATRPIRPPITRAGATARPETKVEAKPTVSAANLAANIKSGGSSVGSLTKGSLTNTRSQPITTTKVGTKLSGTKPGTLKTSPAKGKSTGKRAEETLQSKRDKYLAEGRLLNVTGYIEAKEAGKPLSKAKPEDVPKTLTGGKSYFNAEVGLKAMDYWDFKEAYLDLEGSDLNDGVLAKAINGFRAKGYQVEDEEVEEIEAEVQAKPTIGRKTISNAGNVVPKTVQVKAQQITDQSYAEFEKKLNALPEGKYLNVSKLELSGKGAVAEDWKDPSKSKTVFQDDNFSLRSNSLEKFKLALDLYPINEGEEEEMEELKAESLAAAEAYPAFSKGKPAVQQASARMSPIERKKLALQTAVTNPPKIATSTMKTNAPVPFPSRVERTTRTSPLSMTPLTGEIVNPPRRRVIVEDEPEAEEDEGSYEEGSDEGELPEEEDVEEVTESEVDVTLVKEIKEGSVEVLEEAESA
jgi:hypothetical protein